MKKVLLALLSIAALCVSMQMVQAETKKTIVIIDSAVDSSKIANVIYEVCITKENTCLNKTGYEEGKGSASVNNWKIAGIDHGHNVTQAAISSNPNINIVFIRIADERAKSSHLHSESRQKALDWVVVNASKFNINAVSISASLGLQTVESCIRYPGHSIFRSTVQALSVQNILVFAATGNNGDKKRIGFPACIDNVIAVGATRSGGQTFTSYSNTGPGIDAVARGDISVAVIGKPGLNIVTGTSIATPIAAAFAATNMNEKSLSQFVLTLVNQVGVPQFDK